MCRLALPAVGLGTFCIVYLQTVGKRTGTREWDSCSFAKEKGGGGVTLKEAKTNSTAKTHANRSAPSCEQAQDPYQTIAFTLVYRPNHRHPHQHQSTPPCSVV